MNFSFDIIEPKVKVEPADNLKKFRPFSSLATEVPQQPKVIFELVLPEIKNSQLQAEETPLEKEQKPKKQKTQKYSLGHWTGF